MADYDDAERHALQEVEPKEQLKWLILQLDSMPVPEEFSRFGEDFEDPEAIDSFAISRASHELIGGAYHGHISLETRHLRALRRLDSNRHHG